MFSWCKSKNSEFNKPLLLVSLFNWKLSAFQICSSFKSIKNISGKIVMTNLINKTFVSNQKVTILEFQSEEDHYIQ